MIKSIPDGRFFLNITPERGADHELTHNIWNAETEMIHGNGQVIAHGTAAEMEAIADHLKAPTF